MTADGKQHEQVERYDAVIIGGGPAGLSAALYTAREKMKTLVLDRGAFGGMAAITETIDNYPGFRDGVGGQALIDEMAGQAERFGAHCESFSNVTSIETVKDGFIVHGDDKNYHAKTVLIASGSTYRKLHVPGEDELIGRGLHFCATCDAPLYKDKHAVVIGGGNSAMQESLFIARFARSIDMLISGESFSGSEVLKDAVKAEKRIKVHYNVQTQSIEKPEARGTIHIHALVKNNVKTFEADGIFVFIGLLPNSHEFENAGLDEHNFITSDAAFQTHIPGVFVAGDVRRGSTWQIGAAVGEGVSAALSMRKYTDDRFPGWHTER
ncbi:MAG: FAD-dependent oxidoreductase [Candidatus Saccharimonadales bacterium]